MGRFTTLNEGAMQTAELQIPRLATQAGRAAYGRAIANHSAPLVMTSACGQLVMRLADGAGTMVLRSLPSRTPVRVGTVLTRAKPSP